MLRWLKVLSLSSVALVTPQLAHAGILDGVRSETSGSSSDSDDSSSWSWSDDDDDYDYGYGYGGSGPSCSEDCVGLGAIVAARRYAPYPYARGYRGQMRIVEEDETAPESRSFSGSVAVHGAWFGPTLVRSGVDLQLTGRAVGLGIDLDPMLETRPLDALTLGSVNGLLVPVLRPRVQLLIGMGVNLMIDGRALPSGERTDAIGANTTMRIAVFPVRPLVLRGRVDMGNLGNALSLMFRPTAGLMLRRFEIFAGYEGRAIGNVSMHGPTGGLRVFF